MRRVPAGLAGLALATALRHRRAVRGRGATGRLQGGHAPRSHVRRAAEPGRGEAARAAAGRDPEGHRRPREGRAARRQQGRQGRQERAARTARPPRPRTSTSSSRARRRTRSSSILAEFGNERAPALPRPGHRPGDPGADARSTGRCTTRSRSPTARKDNSTVWQADYPARTSSTSTSARATASSRSRPTTSASRRAATASTARSPTGSRCRYNEARYGRSNGFPCAGNVCRNTWALITDAIDTWVADQKAAGRTDAQIKADLAVLRPVGPQRLRRRRQLQRARRLHRPLPDRPRRRRPGRRRPVPGRGRHLVAPLEGVPGAPARARRPTRTAAPRSATPACGSPTTRSSRRTAACPCSRTSTATTSACRTTTTRPAADNAVNWWTLMAQSRASAAERRGHRHPAGRPRRVGQAPARLARLRDRRRRADPHARPRPARVQLRQGAGRRRRAAARSRSTTQFGAPFAGHEAVVVGPGDDLDDYAVAAGRRCPRARPR